MRTDSDLAQLSLIRAGRDRHLRCLLRMALFPCSECWRPTFLCILIRLVMHEDLRHSPACKRVFDFLAGVAGVYSWPTGELTHPIARSFHCLRK